jgi:peptide/nickel transport system substrate-binding protein
MIRMKEKGGRKKMKGKSKINIGLIIGMALLFVAFPLFAMAQGQGDKNAKPEGTLRIAIASLAEEGFLGHIGDSTQARMYPLVYDHLFYLDEKTDEFIPGLAKRFEYSKDYLTITIYLREGVQFNGGWGEVTAEDVKLSFDMMRAELATASKSPLLRTTIKDVEVLNRYTVALRLKQYSPELWKDALEVGLNVQMGIVCKKYIEKVGDEKARWDPIGSGPYRLVERKSGSYLKFEAFEKHWRVVPEYKYIVMHIAPEESSRVAMLRTGETDVAPISFQTMTQLQKEKGITAAPWPGGYDIFACFGGMQPPNDKRYKEGYHGSDPWAKDIRVREAMNIAIDREAIIKAIYKGAAVPMSIPLGLKGWEKLPPIPYDPERAKKLLAEAGYANGFDVTVISVSDWAPAFEMPQVCEILAGSFKRIGLRPKIKMMSKDYMMTVTEAAKDVGMVFPWKDTYKSVYTGQFHDKYYPGGSEVMFSTPKLSALIDAYLTELDYGKRTALLKEMGEYMYKEWHALPLLMASPTWAYRDAAVGEWPKTKADKSHHFEYIRHAKPLNTWRLFTPGQ